MMFLPYGWTSSITTSKQLWLDKICDGLVELVGFVGVAHSVHCGRPTADTSETLHRLLMYKMRKMPGSSGKQALMNHYSQRIDANTICYLSCPLLHWVCMSLILAHHAKVVHGTGGSKWFRWHKKRTTKLTPLTSLSSYHTLMYGCISASSTDMRRSGSTTSIFCSRSRAIVAFRPLCSVLSGGNSTSGNSFSNGYPAYFGRFST